MADRILRHVLNLAPLYEDNSEFVYYIVEQDKLWISWFNIGNFVQEQFGYHYIYIGKL